MYKRNKSTLMLIQVERVKQEFNVEKDKLQQSASEMQKELEQVSDLQNKL